jgi:hypothetical protein
MRARIEVPVGVARTRPPVPVANVLTGPDIPSRVHGMCALHCLPMTMAIWAWMPLTAAGVVALVQTVSQPDCSNRAGKVSPVASSESCDRFLNFRNVIVAEQVPLSECNHCPAISFLFLAE